MISKNYYNAFRLPAYAMFDTKISPEIMGQFDPMNFVVKIDSQISDALKAEGKSQILFTERGDSRAYAFASYFHEIIHWWQHIGTTAGFFSGMTIPVQTHVNYKHLRDAVIDGTGLRKPLVHQALSNLHNSRNLNIILNNWMDIEFSYGLLNYPEEKAASIVNDQFFESLGHALEIYFYSTVNVLATTFDQDFAGLPDIGQWDREFKRLKQNKVPMWYYGSETTIPPLGMHSILEGQARFQELQYLHISSKAKLSWSDFEQAGLMGRDYWGAFQVFLEITGLSFPKDSMSETVNMFLLLCDIALNPNSGYPDDIHDYESFINDVSPGIRFIRSANIVRAQPSLLTKLIFPDRHDYEEVTQAICHPLNWKTPRETSEAVVRISDRMQGIKQLEKETVDWQYVPDNMPIRFLYARHLSFVRDKTQAPEYFCWPVIYFSDIGDSSTISKKALMERHMPPFLAGSIDGEVKTNLPHCDDTVKEVNLIATYFLWQSIYDITRQWIVVPGPFSFKYPWKNIRDDELQVVLDNFKLTYGCDLDSISEN